MENFLRMFSGILDERDKSQFKVYILILFFGSLLSVIGIGAFIPFINILIQPEKIMRISYFHHWEYQKVVFLLAGLIVSAFVIKNVTAFLLFKFQSDFLLSLVAKIQKKLFLGYMTFDYEYHLERSTPNLIKIINNETNVFAICIVSQIGIILTEFFASICVILFLLYLNPVFTISVVMSLFVFMSIFLRIIRKRLEIHGENRTAAWSEMTSNVLMGLSGIKEAKLYQCEQYFTDKFTAETERLKLATIYQNILSQAPRLLIESVGVFVVLTLISIFIFLRQSPKDMFVIMAVFGVAGGQLFPSINRIVQAVVQIRYGMPALKTIHEEFKLQKNNQDKSDPPNENILLNFNQSITLENIFFQYTDGTLALNNLSVVIPGGKKVAFVGTSGAGKTTLIDLIMCLYKPKNGKILVDDVEIKTQNDRLHMQKLFGYIPQNIQLFDKTIAENVAFGFDKENIDLNYVWECLTMAQLKDFVISLKAKEQSHIGESGIRLSGGQRQRLGIARALYRKPKILVMDEATSALDNNTEKEITDVLLNLRGITVLTIAHRLTTIQEYDLIYMLENGKIVSSGKYDELLNKCKHFQRMSLVPDKWNKVDSYV